MNSIGIIGGTGLLGHIFSQHLSKKGFTVTVSNETTPNVEDEILKTCELIIIVVPIGVTPEVLRRIRKKIHNKALLVDFTSVKGNIEEELKQFNCDVISSHPLFGKVAMLEGQNIINIPIHPGNRSNELTELWETLGMKVTEVKSCQEHDKFMSIIQGLTHMLHMIFASTLRNLSPDMEKLIQICSPVYRSHFAFSSRILGASEDLYRNILMSNPSNKEVSNKLLEATEKMNGIVQNEKSEEFTEVFMEDRKFLSEFLGGFINESDFLIHQLGMFVNNQKET